MVGIRVSRSDGHYDASFCPQQNSGMKEACACLMELQIGDERIVDARYRWWVNA
jgi:hypothetical protein